MRVAVFGAGGLLGRAIVACCREAGDRVVALSHADVDIADPLAVRRALPAGAEIDAIVNAAAATDVDRCEREPAYAWAANVVGPRILAERGIDIAARVLHVSTDYVFSGEKNSPYDELDEPAPLSVYARTKLAGERAVLAAHPANVVARTAWLYGPGGKSFVSKIPEILRAKGEVAAIDDQRSSPSYAPEVAAALRRLAERAAGGLYHVANAGAASYHDVALEAARALGIDSARVRAQPSSAVPRPAPRPRATPLASIALPGEGFAPLRPWAEAYREFVAGSPRSP
jgi:dTDP-4-dehydrorhamnose reductase